MQKTLDILEKNVQWIVLGLAGLFLLWVAYAYVLTPPATVKIDGHVATPADAALVTQVEAKQLDQQIKDSRSVNFPTDDLVTAWEKHIQDPYAAPLPLLAFNTVTQGNVVFDPNTHNPNGMPRIAELPVPPKPQLLPPTAGLSTVSLQAPDAAQNGNAQASAQQTKDTDWVTVSAVIPAAALRDALKAPLKGAPIDPALYNTSLLEVVLERQESSGVDANGTPTFPPADKKNVTPVPALSVYQSTLQKLPADSASKDAQYQFLTWAQQNPSLVSDPAFNQVTAGDPWPTPQLPAAAPDAGTPPGTPASPASVPATGAPDPSAVPAGPGPAGNPRANPPPGAPPATPTPAPTTPVAPPSAAGMKYPSNASYAPLDPSRPPDSGYPRRRGPRDYFPPGFNPGINPGGNAGAPDPNNAAVIDAVNLTNDLLIWATDETVKPGKSYRYRISYKMKNPVFGVTNLAPEALVKQFIINSPPSDWTDAVKAPPVTKFWVASASGGKATLDVFQYQGGTWKTMKRVPANPGDQVPGTDLTLVDVRSPEPGRNQNQYVLLTSDTGEMQRRELATDLKDPDHASMLDPTGAGAGTGTAPPLPPPTFRAPPGRPGRGRGGPPSAFR